MVLGEVIFYRNETVKRLKVNAWKKPNDYSQNMLSAGKRTGLD